VHVKVQQLPALSVSNDWCPANPTGNQGVREELMVVDASGPGISGSSDILVAEH
jgi:hypothetical protein